MIVLDTHVWIWWVNGSPGITSRINKVIRMAQKKDSIFISSISVWETAMLARAGRLVLSTPLSDWISKSEHLPFIHFVPVDNKIAEHSVNLPGDFHRDPADRIIVSTARIMNMTLITSDEKILKYPHVKTEW